MESYVKIKNLLAPREEPRLASTFERLGELLKEAGEEGSIQFRILSEKKRMVWHLDLQGKAAVLKAEQKKHPKLEIVTFSDIWWEVAEGKISPLDALLAGKLRIRGDEVFAERILSCLAATPGKTSVC